MIETVIVVLAMFIGYLLFDYAVCLSSSRVCRRTLTWHIMVSEAFGAPLWTSFARWHPEERNYLECACHECQEDAVR